MKAVMLSVRPEWWKKMLSGEKTLEIRKTHPQSEELYWPITVLVYVSGTGAVQGQFICPGEASEHSPHDLAGPSCVSVKDLYQYARGRRLSGWIVWALEKYDKPRPLAEFGLNHPPMSWQYIDIPW